MMPWKECSVMDERLQFVARRLAGEAMAELCREFGISRKTGYKIFDRYQGFKGSLVLIPPSETWKSCSASWPSPEPHWKTVRATNVIERAFREVRSRTRPMSSFTNPASCDRIVFGVISHLDRSLERKTAEVIYTKCLTLTVLFFTWKIFN
jgi:transposase-like protein